MKLTTTQKRAIKIGREVGIIGYFGGKGYGDYNGNFITEKIMDKLVKMKIYEHPRFSSAHSLTNLGKTIEI